MAIGLLEKAPEGDNNLIAAVAPIDYSTQEKGDKFRKTKK